MRAMIIGFSGANRTPTFLPRESLQFDDLFLPSNECRAQRLPDRIALDGRPDELRTHPPD
jgi:hypothetical protein